MPHLNPAVNFWLSLAAFVAQGITAGAVHLTGMVPADWIPTISAWMSMAVFVWMGFQTVANGVSGPGVGPLAKPLTVSEATKLVDQAHIDAVDAGIRGGGH